MRRTQLLATTLALAMAAASWAADQPRPSPYLPDLSDVAVGPRDLEQALPPCPIMGSGAVLQVSQPVQVTADSYYERGQSIVYDGANYWLVYGRSASVTGNYQNTDPDVNDYVVYYKTASSVAGLVSASATAISGTGVTHNANSYMGETGAAYFGGEVWAFATIDIGTSADLYGWYYDGSVWTEVGPIATGLSDGAAHHDEVEYNGEMFVVLRRGDNFYTTHSSTPKTDSWSSEVSVSSTSADDGGGLCHFFKDGPYLYLAVERTPAPRKNIIFRYNPGTDDWTKIAEGESTGWDPTLFVGGGSYIFAQAPWTNEAGGRQYILGWAHSTLDSTFFNAAPSKMIVEGQYGGKDGLNTWVDMWPIGFTDNAGDSYLFYTSERDTPGAEGTGNIWYLEVNWDPTRDHYTWIQEAINAASTGDTIDVLSDVSEGQVVVDKSLVIRGASSHTVKMIEDTGSSGDDTGWFWVKEGVTVDVSDLKFDGDGHQVFYAFRMRGQGRFTNCDFNDIQYGQYLGIALSCYGDGPVHVDGGTFDDIGRIGVFYYGSGVAGSVCKNITYTGKIITDCIDYGIEFGAGATGSIRNCTITDCTGVASSDGSVSAGILATTYYGAGTDVTISGNTLTDNTYGAAIGYDSSDTTVAIVDNNNISGNDTGGVDSVLILDIADARGNWWGHADGPLDATGTVAAWNGFCADPDEIENNTATGDAVSDENVEYCPWSEGWTGNAMSILDSSRLVCYDIGNTLVVKIKKSATTHAVDGGEYFLAYDKSVLSFNEVTGFSVGEAPYTHWFFKAHNAAEGTIDYATGVNPVGGVGTDHEKVMASLTFTINAENCGGSSLVWFRSHTPASRMTYTDFPAIGLPLAGVLLDLVDVTVDEHAPTITCPADITVNADAGYCSAALTAVGWASATDNCDPNPLIEYQRQGYGWNTGLGDPYVVGGTTITWRATDDCDNYSECVQTVTVTAVNDLVVYVELAPAMDAGPFERCITFELFETGCADSVIVQEVMTFQNSLASATIEVPCGSYKCITAKDTLHTLRRTDLDDFVVDPIIGSQYVAEFTDKTGTGGDDDHLISGNLNNDEYIDILDFGVFVYCHAYASSPGKDTTCITPFPHADFNGDGIVNSVDFTFISNNFLEWNEDDCCGGPPMPTGVPQLSSAGPLTRISIEELKRRGLEELIIADFNQDGWVDAVDVTLFVQGMDR